jgi:hypothetical protein
MKPEDVTMKSVLELMDLYKLEGVLLEVTEKGHIKIGCSNLLKDTQNRIEEIAVPLRLLLDEIQITRRQIDNEGKGK